MKYFKLGIVFFFSISLFASGEIDFGNQRIDSGFDTSHCSEQEDVFFELQCIHGLSAFGPEGYSECAEYACSVDEMDTFLLVAGSLLFVLLLLVGISMRNKWLQNYFLGLNAFSFIPAYWIYNQSWTESNIFQNVLLMLYACGVFFMLIFIMKFFRSDDKNRYLLLFLAIFGVGFFYSFVVHITKFYLL